MLSNLNVGDVKLLVVWARPSGMPVLQLLDIEICMSCIHLVKSVLIID